MHLLTYANKKWLCTWYFWGVCSGAVGWGTVLQARKSLVQFPMVSLEFFIDIILLPALWTWGWLSFYQKWVPGIFPYGLRRAVHRSDNLTTCVYRFSWNLGASTSWNPLGLSRPVMWLWFEVVNYDWYSVNFSLVLKQLYILDALIIYICDLYNRNMK